MGPPFQQQQQQPASPQQQLHVNPLLFIPSDFPFDPLRAGAGATGSASSENRGSPLSVDCRDVGAAASTAVMQATGGRIGTPSRASSAFAPTAGLGSNSSSTDTNSSKRSSSNGDTRNVAAPAPTWGPAYGCPWCRGSPKPILCISSRVHPCETNASYVFLGLLSFLLSEAPQASLLRSLFSVVAVPMLNPDGVVGGLSRCGLYGGDLNRVWESPCPALHTSVYKYKQLLREFKSKGACLLLLVDIHGHSSKQDVFMWGKQHARAYGVPPSCGWDSGYLRAQPGQWGS